MKFADGQKLIAEKQVKKGSVSQCVLCCNVPDMYQIFKAKISRFIFQ